MHNLSLLFGELLLIIVLIFNGVASLGRIEELVTQWAPLIWLAPEEKFFPLNIEDFLPHVRTQSNGSIIGQSFELLRGLGSEQFYLVTKEGLDSLLKNSTSFLYGKNPNTHKVFVYAVVTECSPNLSLRVSDGNTLSNTIGTLYGQSDSYPHFHVTFWTFYAYNEGKEICFLGKVPTPLFFGSCIGHQKIIGSHVGDWEHMSLSFSGKPYPDKMYMSVHDAGVYYKYEPTSRMFKYERQVTRKGILQIPKFPLIVRQQKGRPVLFSAYGSHGIWSAPGEHYYVRVPRLVDKNGYGTAWETWKNLKIFHMNSTDVPFWARFKGKWGNPQSNCFLFKKLGICEFSDGPRGVLQRKQDFLCFK